MLGKWKNLENLDILLFILALKMREKALRGEKIEKNCTVLQEQEKNVGDEV